MSADKWPFNEKDRDDFNAMERLTWQADRAVVNFPVCSIYREVFAGNSAISGVAGTRTLTQLFASLDCYYEPVSEFRIAQSGGMIQPQSVDVVLYGTGARLMLNDLLLLADGRHYITDQLYYNASNDRHEMVCHPVTVQAAEWSYVTTTTTTGAA